MDNSIIYLSVVALILILVLVIGQLRNDIARINRTLEKISKQVGVPDILTESIIAQLKSLISEGKKIQAIKRYRIITGLGLKESSEYIEQLSDKK